MRTVNLGDVCDIVGGGTPAKDNPDYYEGDIPWATVRDMREDIIRTTEFKITRGAVKASSTKIIPRGNVVIATRVGLGKVCFLKQDTAINQDLRGVIPKDCKNLDSRFLFWWFKSISQLIVQAGTGATVQGVTLPFIKSLLMPLPTLHEQKQIVAILDEAFEGIAAATANAEKNLSNARELLKTYLNSIFTKRGEGWVETTLNKISTNLDSKRIPITKSDRSSGEYPYYGASGIVDYVSDYIFEGSHLLVSEDGANLLARSTPIAFSVSGKFWVNNHAHILKFEKMATQKFVEFYLENISLDEFITGAAQPKLNQKALNAIPISIPTSVKEQSVIIEKIESFQRETQRLERVYQQKLSALADLKQSLLQKAFTGELTAETAKAAKKEAVA